MTKTAQIKDNAYSYLKQSGKYREIYERFTFRLPFLFEIGIEDKEQRNFANHIDFFQFHYARFLTGQVKTLHRTFEETDGLKNHQFFDEDLFWQFLGEIKLYLTENEMYESLELYNRSVKKVVKRAGFSFND